MDMVRSAYKSKMRLWEGGPLIPIVWFICPLGTPVFPGVHTFGSRHWQADWQTRDDDGATGEVWGPNDGWSNGEPSTVFGYQRPAGPSSYWVGGAPSQGWTALPREPGGRPTACELPPPPPPPPGPGPPGPGPPIQTTCCTNPIPAQLRVSIAGIGGLGCLDGVSFSINWIAFEGHWWGSASACSGQTVTAILLCGLTSWTLTVTCGGSSHFNTPLSLNCDPFNATFRLGWSGGACGDHDFIATVDVP